MENTMLTEEQFQAMPSGALLAAYAFGGHAHWIKVDDSSVMPIGALNGWSRDEAEWLGVCDPDDIEDFLSECSTIRPIA